MRTQQQIQQIYEDWRIKAVGDPDLQTELDSIRDNDIVERFYTDLAFGTGGLRGVIGAGTNRINIYTVARATLGLSRYLLSETKSPSVAIAYDSRIKSDLFAQHAACILANQGVHVYIFKKLMPTPTLSFAVRKLACDAGIVITASHNPSKYNGYKVYGADGCQITLEAADRILEEMEQCPYFAGEAMPSFERFMQSGSIEYIGDDVVTLFIQAVKSQSVVSSKAGRDLHIVYSPLNGTGLDCVLRVWKETGFTNVIVVPEQRSPDGRFPTCPSPNPETREALALGLDLLIKTKGDLLIATDPDCDRVGIAVRDGDLHELLTGNEVGVLLFDFICKNRIASGTLPEHPVLIKTIVTTEMAVPIAKKYGVEIIDVLTGFKFIGEQIGYLEKAGEESRYIFGFEESYGYLSGGYVRDKDAVDGSYLIAEMTAFYKAQGKTLLRVLEDLYAEYGTYLNHLQSLPFEGRDALMQMQTLIAKLRNNPPKAIDGVGVRAFSDYLACVTRTADGRTMPIDLPSSDVLRFDMEDGCTVVVRPSGTEPKLKIYYSIKAESKNLAQKLCDLYVAFFTKQFS